MKTIQSISILSILFAYVKGQDYSGSNYDPDVCWSMKYNGTPCCPEGFPANYFDEAGDWYRDPNTYELCGVVDGYCWSIQTDEYGFRYPCCINDITTYSDGDGDWGWENGAWCTIRHTERKWNDRELNEKSKNDWNKFKKTWEDEKYNFERISVFVGDNESEINFSWYSTDYYTPKIRVYTKEDKSDAVVYEGNSEMQIERVDIDGAFAFNERKFLLNGKHYYTHRVTISNVQPNSSFYYQRYIYGDWEEAIKYTTYDDKNFQFLFVGDPQIGGSHGRYRPYPQFVNRTTDDEGNCNDAYNWNYVLERAFNFTKTPSVLLSAGDQADDSRNISTSYYDSYYVYELNRKLTNIESQYSAFLYPENMKHIVTAAAVGNHEVSSNSFGRHFNVPNPLTESAVTKNYDGWYTGYNYFFKYNNVLVVVLETNDNTENEYRRIVRSAINKYPETDWRIALFHHDIFGIGKTHSQSDAKERRGVVFNILSKFNFDIVINGHDHVFTSTKFIPYFKKYIGGDYNAAEIYNDSENYPFELDKLEAGGVYKNPNGTLYITANCSTGAKYLDYYKYDEINYDGEARYVNHVEQTFTQSFGVLDFSQKNGKAILKVTTYDADSYEIIDGTYQASVYIKDASGHTTTQNTTFTIDNTAPIMLILQVEHLLQKRVRDITHGIIIIPVLPAQKLYVLSLRAAQPLFLSS